MRGVRTKTSGKWRRVTISVLLVLLLGVILTSVNRVYQKKKRAQEALVRMQEKQQELIEREKFLKESLSRLQTGEGLEFEIRKKLNVAKVGESVAFIVEEETLEESSLPTSSLWQKIKNFFSGLFK